MNVLTALLVSHGTKMNSRYAALAASNNHLQEKVKRKVGYVFELCSKISNLEEKYEKVQQDWHVLDQENKDLRSFNEYRLRRLGSGRELVVKDLQNDLALERLKSQEYRDAAAAVEHRFHDLKLLAFITSMVERGLRMGRTDAKFEQASQNVSNFFLGAKVEFNKAVAALPFISFPFLVKIAKATEGALSEVVNVQPDKIVRLVVPTSVLAMFFPAGETFGWTSGRKESD
ncbi:hypothetical protein Tco_0674724 [Tanacetum coccineum]